MKRRHKYQLLVLAVVLATAGIIGTIAVRSLKRNLVYYLSPEDLLARSRVAQNAMVRLGGIVCTQTLKWNAEAVRLSFKVGMNAHCEGAAVEALATSSPPQMFREGIGVVLEGRYDGRLFMVERLMVKHGNEYHPPKKQDASPHEIVGE